MYTGYKEPKAEMIHIEETIKAFILDSSGNPDHADTGDFDDLFGPGTTTTRP